MTLVAGLSIGGMPAFLGDLLLSWGVPSSITLPTQPIESVHPGQEGLYARGLCQKLVVVRPYLMIAWAGSLSVVREMIDQMDEALPFSHDELKRRPDALFAPLTKAGETDAVEMVALFNDGDTVYPYCIKTRGLDIDGTRIYLLGSGQSAFWKFVQEVPHSIPPTENAEGFSARTVMMRFVGNALMAQYSTKYGLDHSWGGGFEVAYPTPTGFRKIDNILVRAWRLDFNGELRSAEISFLLHYEGAALHVTHFGEHEGTTVVPAMVNRITPKRSKDIVVPEWTIDLFESLKHGRNFCAIEHDRPGSKSHAQFEFSNSVLVGWNMDRSRVERIIQSFDARMDDPFSIGALS